MPVDKTLLNEIKAFLSPLSHFENEASRRALLLQADIEIMYVDFSGNPDTFVTLLLNYLNQHGFKEKIVTILQHIRTNVGEDHKKKIDNFIQQLQEQQSNETIISSAQSSFGEKMQSEKTPITEKKRILIFATCPKDLAQLCLDEEIRAIEESIHHDFFEIQQKGTVRSRDIIKTLLTDREFQLIHFSGHGNENGIFIEDEQGNATLLNPEGLADLFKELDYTPECVLLNSCNSEKSAKILGKIVPNVIGMNFKIGDVAAIDFSGGFYSALGAGKSYKKAFEIGKIAIKMTNNREHLYPVFNPQFDTEDEEPFINRKKELSEISTIPYLLIDAPSQYGKTELLQHLQKKYPDKYYVPIELSDSSSIQDMLCQILLRLQKCRNGSLQACHDKPCFPKDINKLLSDISMCMKEASELKKASEPEIALYIDRAERLPDVDVIRLFQKVLPQIAQQIVNINKIDLQIILAGRYISRWKDKIASLPFQIKSLSPFDCKAIQKMVVTHDKRNNIKYHKNYQQDFAAVLLYLTGGHPGLMLSVLEPYYRQPIRNILNNEHNIYAGNAFEDVFEELDAQIDSLNRPFKELSVFRRYTDGLLDNIIKKKMVSFSGSATDLKKHLLSSYFVNIDEKNKFIQDDIVRRVFAIRLRHELGDAAFAERCKQARDIYTAYLRKSDHAPHLIATEILFEEIQRRYYISQQKPISSDAHNTFFSQALQDCLTLLQKKSAVEKFNEMLQDGQDWEFRFAVNFYLRQSDDYTDVPYQKLCEDVRAFLNAHQSSNVRGDAL